jgi:hypothetical protein
MLFHPSIHSTNRPTSHPPSTQTPSALTNLPLRPLPNPLGLNPRQPPLLLDLPLNIVDSLVQLPLGIARYTQERLPSAIRRRIPIVLSFSPFPSSSTAVILLDHARPGSSLLQRPLQVPLRRASEESHARRRADDGVEVHPRPGLDGSGEAKDEERGDDEGEGELRDEPGEDVVVSFRGQGFLSCRVEEEGAEIAPEVYETH